MTNIETQMPEIDFAHDALPDFHDILARLRERGPVVRVKFHGAPTWAILTHEAVNRAFTDPINFNQFEGFRIISEPSMGHNLQTMEPDEHRTQRGMVAGFFLPRAVRGYVEKLIEPIANEIADRIEGQDQVDLVREFARPYPFTVITRLLGIPVQDEDRLLDWAVKLIDFPWDPEGALRARNEFDEYMTAIIQDRKRKPQDDLISAMAAAEKDGVKMTNSELLSFCRLLFPAGSDTAFKGIGSMFAHVLGRQDLREQAAGSDADREALVAECLRFEPPLPFQPFLASGDVQFGDVVIARGEWTVLSIASANRDPEVYADPGRFDARRDNRELTTFGRGAHFCIGMHLARRELECALKILLGRFPKMRLKPGVPVEIIGTVLRGPSELWVQPYGEVQA